MRAHTYEGGAHHQRVSTTLHLTRKNSHKFFLSSGRDSNLYPWHPLDLEADALPIEPPSLPSEMRLNQEGDRSISTDKWLLLAAQKKNEGKLRRVQWGI